MKKYIVAGIIILSTDIIASNTTMSHETIIEKRGVKILVINLDKEGEDGNKGASDILSAIIHIGNNDEVQFVGKNTLMARPITTLIKDEFNKVKKTLIDTFTIKTSDLAVGDTVVILDSEDEPLVEKKVEK